MKSSVLVIISLTILLCSAQTSALPDSIPLKTARQGFCRACPSRCLSRRNANRQCREECALGRCRVRRDRRRCTTRPRFFRCVPVRAQPPAPPPTPAECPNRCTSDPERAARQCARATSIALGCRVRSCVLSSVSNGVICALPGPMVMNSVSPSPSPTSSPAASVSPSPTSSPPPGVTPSNSPTSSPSATPSLTPTPSMSCTVTMRGSIGSAGINGVCMCGTRTRSVILLQPAGVFNGVMCLNNCYDRLLSRFCTPDNFVQFVNLASVAIDTCCESCQGRVVSVFNQCTSP